MTQIANIVSYLDTNIVVAKVYKDDNQTGEYKIQDIKSSEGYWYPTLDQLKEELDYLPFIEAWNNAIGMKDAIYMSL